MASWTALVGAGLSLYLTRRTRRLADVRAWQRDTAAIQLAQLRGVLARGAQTAFGREHGLARLLTLPDRELVPAFRAAVAAGDYEKYRATLDRMHDQGEPDLLWPGRVMHFAQTSGTTAGDKYIPVTAEMFRSNYRAACDIFAYARTFGVSLTDLCAGRALFLGGSTDLTVGPHGIATGDLSGLVTPLIRWPISAIYLPGREVALISDWPTKLDAMARACVDADVRMINGIPSWGLLLFERVMSLARARGRRVSCLHEVWPHLRLFVHGGVKYTPFEARVRQAWSGAADGPDVPWRLELYPASEGFIAIQDRRGDPGLRLNADLGMFFEFIPLERVHDPDPEAFTADAVEKGQRYVVCMTTCAGLYRYIIGDVVEFDTVPDAPAWGRPRSGDGPARLRIVGRHRHFINAFGENLIVEHIENAVAAAARAVDGLGRAGVVGGAGVGPGVTIGEFTAAPVYPGLDAEGRPRRAGLELVIEVEGLSPAGLATLGRAFDESLKAQNVDYTTKRGNDVGMVAPTVTAVPLGTFHRWMQARGKLGGQHKCPRCANHREFVDAVRAMAMVQTGATTRDAARA